MRSPWGNRFAVPTSATLERYRLARGAAMAKARLVYDAAGDARLVNASVAEAREWQRKVLWARRSLGMSGTAPGS